MLLLNSACPWVGSLRSLSKNSMSSAAIRAGLERVCGAVWAYLGGFWPGFFNRSPWYAQLEASEFKHRPWWPKRAPFEFAPVCRKRGGWSDELPPVLAALQVTTHDRQVRALLALLGQLRQVNLQCRGGGGGAGWAVRRGRLCLRLRPRQKIQRRCLVGAS